MAAVSLICSEWLSDANSTVGSCYRAAPTPPIRNFGTALRLIAGALDTPVYKGGTLGCFILQQAAADAATLQIFEDSGIVPLRPFLHALLHNGDLHPWRWC